MSEEKRTATDASDAAFAARVAEAFSPPEMTSSRRAAIDASVRARLEGGARVRTRFAMAVSAAAAIALALYVFDAPDSGVERTANAPASERQFLAAAAPETDATWAYTLLFEPSDPAPAEQDAVEELPADYRAITDVWLDG